MGCREVDTQLQQSQVATVFLLLVPECVIPFPSQPGAGRSLGNVAGKQRSFIAFPLPALTMFPCICPGLDASPPASTHELTIPNDVSKSKCFLGMSVCVCVCTYMFIYTYIYLCIMCSHLALLNIFRDVPSPCSLILVQSVGDQSAAQSARWTLLCR